MAKNHNFGQILTFGDSCTEHRLLMGVKFCVLQETHAKFHVNVFFVLASGSPKPQFWTNCDIWGGAPVPIPFYR